jgi:hypothetical protein
LISSDRIFPRRKGAISQNRVVLRSNEMALLTIYFYEDVIDVKRVTIAPILFFQPFCIKRTELDTPKTNGLSTDYNASFSE